MWPPCGNRKVVGSSLLALLLHVCGPAKRTLFYEVCRVEAINVCAAGASWVVKSAKIFLINLIHSEKAFAVGILQV